MLGYSFFGYLVKILNRLHDLLHDFLLGYAPKILYTRQQIFP